MAPPLAAHRHTPAPAEGLPVAEPVPGSLKTPGVQGPNRIYIWFDLGDVLIGSRDQDDRYGQYDPRNRNMRFLPGALAYLRKLQAAGYTLGLITNIPESFGKPGDAPSKVKALKEYVAERWVDRTPFDWSAFENILVPLFEHERKPASKLFRDARTLSACAGKIGFYQGEACEEIVAARLNGMTAAQVTYNCKGAPKFVRIRDIDDAVRRPKPVQCPPPTNPWTNTDVLV